MLVATTRSRIPVLALPIVLLGLVLGVLPGLAGAAAAPAPAAAAAASAAPGGNRFTPPNGVLLSDPTIPGRKRVILDRIIAAVNATKRGEYVRTAVWNYDDRRTTDALLAAHRRGVHVQVVVADSVRNANWNRTTAALNANRKDRSFATRCRGGCRSRSILHAKFVLISKVGRAEKVSMVGSFNLTRPAGYRQWNDLVTTSDKRFYDQLVTTFREYAQDRNLARPYRRTTIGSKTITLWPSFDRNTIRDELGQVRCNPPGGYRGPTRVRIAIAGWFDEFGTSIARTVRRLWDSGCDVKIITTLAGRGVNRVLKSGRGRGPVPIRRLIIDNNGDRVPEKYLHMKAIAIRGGFGKDASADVLMTGSPNWSARANRSDEILFRFLSVPVYVKRYSDHVDRLFRGPMARREITDGVRPPADGGGAYEIGPGRRPSVPSWYELS